MDAFDPRPRFMMDHMVIRLGKYLRIIGYDADWDLGLRTHELILRANATGRIFVTRNLHITNQYPPVRRMILLTHPDPAIQFKTLVQDLHLDTRSALFSRCIRCNEALVSLPDKEAAKGQVHPNVLIRQERFFRCPHCGTIFWHGSHVANTCRKLELEPPLETS
jgi:uncharacterized protein with PIN domain